MKVSVIEDVPKTGGYIRKGLTEQVWDVNLDRHANGVEVAIRRLRAKVDDPSPGKFIHTLRGVGYVMEGRD